MAKWVQGAFEVSIDRCLKKECTRIRDLGYTKLNNVRQSNNLSVIFSIRQKLFASLPDSYLKVTCNFIDSGPLIINREQDKQVHSPKCLSTPWVDQLNSVPK